MKICYHCRSTDPVDGFEEREIRHMKWNPLEQKNYVGTTWFVVCKKYCGNALEKDLDFTLNTIPSFRHS